MKKVIRFLSLAVIFTLLMNFIAVAMPGGTASYLKPVTVTSKLLDPSIGQSIAKEYAIKRGEFFSLADLAISNKNGQIGVAAHAYMSIPIDDLYMTIYLDRLNSKGTWDQVDLFDFEFHSENYPKGLTSETVAFVIGNQPKDNYYRLRASFLAFKDGENEGFGPMTEGILIQSDR